MRPRPAGLVRGSSRLCAGAARDPQGGGQVSRPPSERDQERRTGRVVAFDERRGLGEVERDGERFPFHCTAIADGTRSIEVGASVEFEVAAGPLGRWEATAIGRA